MKRPFLFVLAVLGLSLLSGAGGYWLATSSHSASVPSASHSPAASERQALYWYDPMYPQQQFPGPGKSPFMDMKLVPRYADDAPAAASSAPSVRIDADIAQNLGMRLATVTRGTLTQSLQASGVLAFNQRDVALLQTRAAGFVERTYGHAPGDLVRAGEPIAELLMPQWAAAQEEFLALRRAAEPELLAAARQRLRLLGMPAEQIVQLQRSGHAQTLTTLRSPIAGVIDELKVRLGMTLAAGDTLARINGLDQVWLELALPEAQAGDVQAGQVVEAQLAAFPGELFKATVASVLPAADAQSRTLRVRVELANPDGRLRPGMSAQVRLSQASSTPVLQLPSEAVIRTGKRALVMLAEAGGHFRPVEVQLGREGADLNGHAQQAILAGLSEGQQVVASGQFLLDSEASLSGLQATPLPAMAAPEPEPELTPSAAPASNHGATQP